MANDNGLRMDLFHLKDNVIEAVQVTHQLVRRLPRAGSNPESTGNGVKFYPQSTNKKHDVVAIGDYLCRDGSGEFFALPAKVFSRLFRQGGGWPSSDKSVFVSEGPVDLGEVKVQDVKTESANSDSEPGGGEDIESVRADGASSGGEPEGGDAGSGEDSVVDAAVDDSGSSESGGENKSAKKLTPLIKNPPEPIFK